MLPGVVGTVCKNAGHLEHILSTHSCVDGLLLGLKLNPIQVYRNAVTVCIRLIKSNRTSTCNKL